MSSYSFAVLTYSLTHPLTPAARRSRRAPRQARARPTSARPCAAARAPWARRVGAWAREIAGWARRVAAGAHGVAGRGLALRRVAWGAYGCSLGAWGLQRLGAYGCSPHAEGWRGRARPCEHPCPGRARRGCHIGLQPGHMGLQACAGVLAQGARGGDVDDARDELGHLEDVRAVG
eukprot:scaffold92278_cov62-Phaeocystis_antarctica.AAC.6